MTTFDPFIFNPSNMQFKFVTAVFAICLATFASASPVPALVAQAAVQAREIGDELNDEVAREPVCAKYQCF
ncbi:hypothetical protein HYPSUDRAFT_33316 [Hypholoma sublateritium FD-334 SS-4]|uniref:Uncharacterized protein n=1 Tax=Hypholoma sublateritium (strain FD-334 SS-4) TaxID=945553 RepID=A0A0D2PKG3_HYPSF|nr:hypothetical protein HYPSUDRAFT_33316 [Hypholoma sublateritium FD-334 SS-4]